MQELSANTIEIIAGAGPEPGPIEPQMPKMDPFFIPDFTKDAQNGKLPPSIEGPGGVKPFVWGDFSHPAAGIGIRIPI